LNSYILISSVSFVFYFFINKSNISLISITISTSSPLPIQKKNPKKKPCYLFLFTSKSLTIPLTFSFLDWHINYRDVGKEEQEKQIYNHEKATFILFFYLWLLIVFRFLFVIKDDNRAVVWILYGFNLIVIVIIGTPIYVIFKLYIWYLTY